MRSRAFSVYDVKAKAYLPPFFFTEIGQATRVFTDAVNDGVHMFSKHPEDYSLFEIGLYDDSTALLEPYGPELVVSALQVVGSVPEPDQKPLFEGVK